MSEGVLGKLYADGELIVRQGEMGNCMYVVQSGKLEVLREEHDGSVRIGVMEVGEFFGEMSIFEHEVRSASVRALGEARVMSIDKRTFLRRMEEDPPLAFNLLTTMAHRVRRLTGEVASLKLKIAAPAPRLNGEERRTGHERRGGRERRAAAGKGERG
jgi:CRP-like cAMP-binding protein